MTDSHSHTTSSDLSPLTRPIESVNGIGEKRAAALIEAGIESVEDLLLHVPRLYLDRRKLLPVTQVEVDTTATVVGTVKQTHVRSGRRKRFFEVYLVR